jgi:hypothetical protein
VRNDSMRFIWKTQMTTAVSMLVCTQCFASLCVVSHIETYSFSGLHFRGIFFATKPLVVVVVVRITPPHIFALRTTAIVPWRKLLCRVF